jgi:putative ABC transport system permease protein
VKIYWKIIKQSIRLSIEEIISSKLRSFLSLLGVAIGVLCVVAISTAVTSLEKNIENSFSSFGTDILYVQKWPWIWTDGDNYPWWRYLNRPNVNKRELEQIEKKISTAKAIALINFSERKTVKYLDREAENISLTGATKDYDLIKNFDFSSGRYFTDNEFVNGTHVCIIGANVADALLGGFSQKEGHKLRVGGIELVVNGVLKREGDDLFGFTLDNSIVVPYNTISLFTNENNAGDPLIAFKPKDGIPFEEMKYEVKGAMRAIRRLPPEQEDNFALNKMSVFTDGISSILSFVAFAGFIIGGFSLLVGGFGIANIMFVSVKERTNIIGIKKALGAKQVYILLEFLLEAIILCLFGGLIGLIMMFGLIKGLEWYLVNFQDSTFKFYFTLKNISIGFILSFIIGVISGLIPAYKASKMRPVDAIRS